MKILFYCLLVILPCEFYSNKSDDKIDEIFINWNIATSKSIQSQEDFTNNGYQKSLYKNRLEAFKAYIEVADFNQLNKKSIRCKLLDQNLDQWGDKFYIVEANESGERSRKLSYIIIPTAKNGTKIIQYEYQNAKWVKVKESAVGYIFKYDRERYIAPFGKAKNEDDVVVTYIENSKVICSDFFLIFTMKPLEIIREQ